MTDERLERFLRRKLDKAGYALRSRQERYCILARSNNSYTHDSGADGFPFTLEDAEAWGRWLIDEREVLDT